jgi:hypothetical protein
MGDAPLATVDLSIPIGMISRGDSAMPMPSAARLVLLLLRPRVGGGEVENSCRAAAADDSAVLPSINTSKRSVPKPGTVKADATDVDEGSGIVAGDEISSMPRMLS